MKLPDHQPPRIVACLFLSLFLLSSVSALAQSKPQSAAQTDSEKESLLKQEKDAQPADSSTVVHPATEAEANQTRATHLAAKPQIAVEKVSFFKDLIRDQKRIWTGPFQIKKSDAKWVGALAATTTILLLTDKPLPLHHNHAEEILKTSDQVSKLGEGYSTFGFAGGIYLLGKITNNERAKETGLLATEALINTAVVTSTLKMAFRRQRPSSNAGKGEFWSGGSSFPSGHAGSVWALATVVAEEYRDKPWVRIGAYGYATAVSLSRFTGRNHFASDVLVGSAIGYLTGRFVVRKHTKLENNKKVTAISPYFNHTTRAYGIQGTINF
jgi:membrane-associated phospholipid phosphatase